MDVSHSSMLSTGFAKYEAALRPDTKGNAAQASTKRSLPDSSFEPATAGMLADPDGKVTRWNFSSWRKADKTTVELPRGWRNDLRFDSDPGSSTLHVRGYTKDRIFDGTVQVDNGKTVFGDRFGDSSKPFTVHDMEEDGPGVPHLPKVDPFGREAEPDPAEVKKENDYIDTIRQANKANVKMGSPRQLQLTTPKGDVLIFTRD
jgi:hypothetical protein